jgi:hypothetical protein
VCEENLPRCARPHPFKNANQTEETEKAPFLVVKRIREAILDKVFQPGDHRERSNWRRSSKSAAHPFAKRWLPWKKKARSL